MRNLWSNWMDGEANYSFTKGGKLKKPLITIWCQWVVKAWDEIDPTIMRHSRSVASLMHWTDQEDNALYGDDSDTDPFADIDNKDEDNPCDEF